MKQFSNNYGWFGTQNVQKNHIAEEYGWTQPTIHPQNKERVSSAASLDGEAKTETRPPADI